MHYDHNHDHDQHKDSDSDRAIDVAGGAGRHEPPAPKPGGRGQTTERRDGEQEPRLPHEHDESADSQAGMPREKIRQAQLDLEAGRVDTDRGPPMEEVYDRELRSESHAGALEPAADAAPESRENGPRGKTKRPSVR